jgi:hypothetical protein
MYSARQGKFISRDPHVNFHFISQGDMKISNCNSCLNTGVNGSKIMLLGSGSGYHDGMSLYGAFFCPNALDPHGLSKGKDGATCDPKKNCDYCFTEYQTKTQMAERSHTNDVIVCGTGAGLCLTACGVGCAATTFGWGICFAICGAGCAAVEAGCLVKAHGDRDNAYAQAKLDYDSCMRDCKGDK